MHMGCSRFFVDLDTDKPPLMVGTIHVTFLNFKTSLLQDMQGGCHRDKLGRPVMLTMAADLC